MKMSLQNERSIKLINATDLWQIMRAVLKRENLIAPGQHYFWVIAMDPSAIILNIELISVGPMEHTKVRILDILSIPLQKNAVTLALVQNRPHGALTPTEADDTLTEQLLQASKLLEMSVCEHLIISEEKFYSFREKRRLKELDEKKKNTPEHSIMEQMREDHEKNVKRLRARIRTKYKKRSIDTAKRMLEDGMSNQKVKDYTGLSIKEIEQLKQDEK